MPCLPIEGAVVCTGPKTEAQRTGRKISAAYCPACKHRTVLELVAHWPIEPSYYGPHFTWTCECGGEKPAPGWDVE